MKISGVIICSVTEQIGHADEAARDQQPIDLDRIFAQSASTSSAADDGRDQDGDDRLHGGAKQHRPARTGRAGLEPFQAT